MSAIRLLKRHAKGRVRSFRQAMNSWRNSNIPSDVDLERIAVLLKQIVTENGLAAEPPKKWAIFNRFHVANDTKSRDGAHPGISDGFVCLSG